jgi:hypothetical protein
VCCAFRKMKVSQGAVRTETAIVSAVCGLEVRLVVRSRDMKSDASRAAEARSPPETVGVT